MESPYLIAIPEKCFHVPPCYANVVTGRHKVTPARPGNNIAGG